MSIKKICIITTVHSPFDVRIFYREAKTLSALKECEIYLIAPYDKNKTIDKVKIIQLPIKKGRFYRFLIKDLKALFEALKLNANIYHFHDFELIPIGLTLKLFGKKIIYDVHENVSSQIYSKEYIPSFLRKMVSFVVKFAEYLSLSLFDKIIIAGEDIGLQPHFRKFSHKIVLLRNFPVISLSEKDVFPKPQDKINFIYTGGLSEDRGILELIQAFREVRGANAELLLLGSFASNDFKKRVMDEIKGCDNIRYISSVSYKEMFAILVKCHVGLICFKPTPNNIGALSGRNNKIYEYMQAGLAIIGSNFPSWKEFIEGNSIGITVDPYDPSQIKEAMEFFITNLIELSRMERNARLLSREFSWEKRK